MHGDRTLLSFILFFKIISNISIAYTNKANICTGYNHEFDKGSKKISCETVVRKIYYLCGL